MYYHDLESIEHYTVKLIQMNFQLDRIIGNLERRNYKYPAAEDVMKRHHEEIMITPIEDNTTAIEEWMTSIQDTTTEEGTTSIQTQDTTFEEFTTHLEEEITSTEEGTTSIPKETTEEETRTKKVTSGAPHYILVLAVLVVLVLISSTLTAFYKFFFVKKVEIPAGWM